MTLERLTQITSVGIASGITLNSATLSGVTTLTTLSASGNISGVAGTFTDSVTVGAGLSVVGVSTFTNGPVLIGSGTSTGTATQRLQVTGGAYVSGNLGIGTTNPQYETHLYGNKNGDVSFTITNKTNGISARSYFALENDLGGNGAITFTSSSYTSSGDWRRPSALALYTSSANTAGGIAIAARNTAGYIDFYTGGNTQRAIITSTGDVGIGSTIPTQKLDVNGTIRSYSGTNAGTFKDNQLRSDSSGTFYFDHGTVGQSFQFRTSTSSSLDTTGPSITSAGNIAFASGKGIDFSATANSSGTMTSEILADYEEGTFSPTAFGNSTAGTTTYGLQYGMYVKIGNLCHFQVRMQVTNMTGTGDLILGGLPFTVFNDSERAYASVAVGYLDNLVFGNVADTHLALYTNTNSTNIVVRSSGNNRSSTSVPVDTAFTILYGGTYRTA